MKSTIKTMLATAGMVAVAGTASAQGIGIEKIGLAVPNLQADYFNQIKLGVEGYAAKLGIEVITVDAKNDTNTQVSQVQDLLTQGIDAFIYIPAGAAAAAVAFARARGAKQGKLIEHVTSHEVEARGKPTMWVGYASVVF